MFTSEFACFPKKYLVFPTHGFFPRIYSKKAARIQGDTLGGKRGGGAGTRFQGEDEGGASRGRTEEEPF